MLVLYKTSTASVYLLGRGQQVVCRGSKEFGERSTNIRLTTRQKPAHDADETLSVIRRAVFEVTTAQATFQTRIIARLDSWCEFPPGRLSVLSLPGRICRAAVANAPKPLPRLALLLIRNQLRTQSTMSPCCLLALCDFCWPSSHERVTKRQADVQGPPSKCCS